MQNETRLLPLERALHKGMRSSLIGIGSNLVLAMFKCVAGVLGHCFAMVADGIESSSDVVSSLGVFLGLKFLIKPPDEDHYYGHGKAEPIAAVVVSLFHEDLDATSIVVADTSEGKKLGKDHPYSLIARNSPGSFVVVNNLAYIRLV